MRGIRLFGFMVLSSAVMAGAIAGAQTNAAQTPDAKAVNAADAAPAQVDAPPPAPEFPKRPAELPPKPPKVTCHGDQITISADNSALDAILFAVRGCTGAHVDVPSDASRIRSFEELGPGPVREVLDQLLSGTPYNYVIQSSDTNPLKVEQVLVTVRTKDSDKPGSTNTLSPDLPMTAGRRAWQHMQKFDKPDPATLNSDGIQVQSDAATPADEATAASTAEPADSNAAGAADAAPAEAAAAGAPPTPVAPPIIDPNSTADPSKVVQDRITQMQQMFAQRQQMMQKQNQGTPGSTPNN